MNEKIYLNRQENLKNVLSENKLDGLLITNLTNIRYICGFTGSAGACLVTQEGQYFITDGRYIEQSKDQVKGFKRFIDCLLYTSPSPRDATLSRMPSSA